jgi:lipopolysaccharide/colanic/teichoic acid biosynthesis glycosyltransferase/glycosyltransferase involved in cell wall biosynthesis
MISVIIPARDAAGTIEDCLSGVLSQRGLDLDYEIIVVDDGSMDNTADIAESLGVKVIRQNNAGPSAARNAGARTARGDILAFTDADCSPSPEWLFHLTQPFQDPEVVGTKGTYRTQQKKAVPSFVQQEYGFKYVRMARQDKIDFIDTYSAAYRRDIFWENNGFDEVVHSVEDQEFSFRLARKGYRLVFAPQAIVYHQHNSSAREYILRKFKIGFWKAFMLRWLPEKTFGDSHTPPTLRWQILFLALTLILALVSGIIGRPGLWVSLVALSLFYISALPFLIYISRNDRKILSVAPWLLLLRAGGLGFGLVCGLVYPPKTKPQPHPGLSSFERLLKRIVDILGALVGLVILSPVLLLSAIAIKIDSAGGVIFSQERVGENGKAFRLFKLRTMGAESAAQIDVLLNHSPLEGPVYKIPNDPRITRTGRFNRRWSLDEIPQFWNILKGEMSLVGPRPEETWVVEQYDDTQRQRLVMKPGLTGPMQISGRGVLSMDERLELEMEYINHYSVWKDIKIIFQTIPAVISGRGAF